MAAYSLRFFFDVGSGTCLWAGNKVTEAKFGSAIDVDKLPLNRNTLNLLRYLIAWHDMSMDLVDAPQPGPFWNEEDEPRFQAASKAAVETLKRELGPEFEVVDETQPM